MALPFSNRLAAADELSDKLKRYAEQGNVTVVGLPRGGIPLAARIAENLDAPLNVLVVEKIRLGGNGTYGSVANGEIEVSGFNRRSGFSPDGKALAMARKDALRSLASKNDFYRSHSAPCLSGRCAMIVDDGIASGLTMLTAAKVAKRDGADQVILASPVASPQAAEMLKEECDQLVCLAIPKPFNNLAECYIDFTPLSDETCADILRAAGRNYERHE